jgi:hypothetical protein
MARATGLEPATSGVTGRHSNRLSYARASVTGGASASGSERGDKRGGRECQAAFEQTSGFSRLSALMVAQSAHQLRQGPVST